MIAGAKIRDNSAKIKESYNTKKLYNLVNNITWRVKLNPMPPGKTDLELADDFAGFFLDKIIKIREDLAGCDTYRIFARIRRTFFGQKWAKIGGCVLYVN